MNEQETVLQICQVTDISAMFQNFKSSNNMNACCSTESLVWSIMSEWMDAIWGWEV